MDALEFNAPTFRDMLVLAALEEGGRLTGGELSEQLNLSESQCTRERGRLERAGVIVGYCAILDNNKLGLGFLVFMNITLINHSEQVIQKFVKIINDVPQVLEAYMVGGGDDYLLKIVSRNPEHLHRLITEKLLPSNIISRINTNFAYKALKRRGSVARSLLEETRRPA